MRSTFSSIMHKRIYTLHCDRASRTDKTLYNKLANAIRTNGVVIRYAVPVPLAVVVLESALLILLFSVLPSTPTSIKSIMLKFMEMLHLIEDESGPRHPQMEADAKELARILNLFRSGVLIMDEVDLILHPLKSELNFPIGPKLDLDFAPLRWKLPIHLLDAIFYADGGSLSVGFKESNRALGVLEKLKEVIIEGYKQRALQRNPHIVLLNPDYYHKFIKPIVAQWALLWLESQNLTGTSP